MLQCCAFGLKIKQPPPRVQFLARVQSFCCRPPGCVNPLAGAHLGAEGGEVMATTSGNTCSSRMSQCKTLPGAISGHFERVRHGAKGSFIKGNWHNIKADSTKVRLQQPRCKELVPFLVCNQLYQCRVVPGQ